MNTAGLVFRLRFFPHSRINQVPPEVMRDKLIEVFEQWGQPGAVRVDNGEPLGSPNGYAPPALSLWLIAKGIKMIWNQPRSPTQNAKVEKLQDTTSRWAEVHKAKDLEDLQQRLNEGLLLQREQYPVHRLSGKTRIEAFPELLLGRRTYRKEDFEPERVWAYLRKCVFNRHLSPTGVLAFLGVQTPVGRAYKRRWAQVRLSKESLMWEVLVEQDVIKTYPAEGLSKERLQALNPYPPRKAPG